jgi:hypothetical protein
VTVDAFWSDRVAMHRAAPPFAVIDGIAVHGDGWAPDVGWGLFGDVAIAHPDFIAAECAINLATAYRPEVP